MSSDLKLAITVDADNPTAHDLMLTNDQITFVSGSDAIMQHLRVRLRFFLGEWFLDRREGVPYFRDVLIKNPSRNVLTSVFRQIILDTPGVEVLRSFDLMLNTTTRSLDIAFKLTTIDGDVLAADFGEFIVEVI